jgi:hypothetical protein
MPATATNYDVSHIHQGPGDLWVIGGGVVDSAAPQLTLSGGTPDSTAHPASLHFGATKTAQTIVVKPKITDIRVDQADAPVARFYSAVAMDIEGELSQLDPTILQNAIPYAVYATAGGYKQLTFGGASSGLLTPLCIAMISPKRGVAGKYIVSILFNAHGMAGLNLAIGREKDTSNKVQFSGLADLSRTAGRQIGVFYETL